MADITKAIIFAVKLWISYSHINKMWFVKQGGLMKRIIYFVSFISQLPVIQVVYY